MCWQDCKATAHAALCCGKQPLTHGGQEALSDKKLQAAQSHQGVNAGSGCRQLLTRSASRVRLRTPHTQQCTAASHIADMRKTAGVPALVKREGCTSRQSHQDGKSREQLRAAPRQVREQDGRRGGSLREACACGPALACKDSFVWLSG